MKIDVLTIYPDQTFDLTRRKVAGDTIKIRGHNPKLIVGKSVFPERSRGFWKRIGLKRKLRLVLWNYGSDICFTQSKDAGKLDDHWNTEEAANFVNKIIAWAAAKTKLFSKFEVYVFWILLGVVAVMQFLIIRRIGI